VDVNGRIVQIPKLCLLSNIGLRSVRGGVICWSNSEIVLKIKTRCSESASELYRPSDRRLSAKWLPTFADRGCHVVSVTDPNGRISRFSRQEPLLFYQVAPQLYSRGWVDPVPDPLLLRKSGSAGNRTRASGSLPRTLTTRPQRRSNLNLKHSCMFTCWLAIVSKAATQWLSSFCL
jgi:hypothetical protein